MPGERSGPPQRILDNQLIGRIIPEGDAGLDSQRRSFVGLPLATKLEEITSDSETTDRHLRSAQEILTLRHALLDPVERERLQLRVIAIGPRAEGDRLVIEEEMISEYSLYLIGSRESGICLSTSRTRLAESQEGTIVPASRENLNLWDSVVQEQAEIWEEGPSDIYNRYIQEIRGTDQRLTAIINKKIKAVGRGEVNQLYRLKILTLLSYLEAANSLQGNFPAEEPLYEAPHVNTYRNPLLRLYPIRNNNIASILAEEIEETDLERDPEAVPTKINANRLRQHKRNFNAGNESEESGAATAICDILGIQELQSEPNETDAS